MKLLDSITDAFIMTLGITPPKPDRRRRASYFIGGALFFVLAGVAGLFVAVIVHLLHR